MIFAIDFDGTITKEDKFPDIGDPNFNVINTIKLLKSQGHQIILWTSRSGDPLNRAIDFCNKLGLEFDAINKNIPGVIDQFEGPESRKVYANYYIDDKNISINEFVNNF